MPLPEIRILGLPGLPEITAGDDLGRLIAEAVGRVKLRIGAGDIFVVTQKVVSKAEGRVVQLGSVEPSAKALEWAEAHGKDPRVVEVVLQQAKRIVRMERGVLIAETHHGFVCANAGVDASNAPTGTVTLLPEDPDASAERLQAHFKKAFGARVGVIISDTFGRPWREGVANVAVGVSGLEPLLDYRGQPDTFGRRMEVTVVAIADELAAAAELVMKKTRGVPVAIVQGYDYQAAAGSARALIRPKERDLFR